MPISTWELDLAIQVAERFVNQARKARKRIEKELEVAGVEGTTSPCYFQVRSKETAAVRRASLDLTQALADLRRPQQ